jgi:hypothetical protein
LKTLDGSELSKKEVLGSPTLIVAFALLPLLLGRNSNGGNLGNFENFDWEHVEPYIPNRLTTSI